MFAHVCVDIHTLLCVTHFTLEMLCYEIDVSKKRWDEILMMKSCCICFNSRWIVHNTRWLPPLMIHPVKCSRLCTFPTKAPTEIFHTLANICTPRLYYAIPHVCWYDDCVFRKTGLTCATAFEQPCWVCDWKLFMCVTCESVQQTARAVRVEHAFTLPAWRVRARKNTLTTRASTPPLIHFQCACAVMEEVFVSHRTDYSAYAPMRGAFGWKATVFLTSALLSAACSRQHLYNALEKPPVPLDNSGRNVKLLPVRCGLSFYFEQNSSSCFHTGAPPKRS